MTPLAHLFAKELALPLSRRTIDDRAHVLPRLDRVHSFDCSAIADSVYNAMEEARETGDITIWETIRNLMGDLFLPAEVTWLEVGRGLLSAQENTVPPVQGLLAYVIEKEADGWFRLDLAMLPGEPDLVPWSMNMARVRRGTALDHDGLQYRFGPEIGKWGSDDVGSTRRMIAAMIASVVLMLDIINQPTLCRLKTHQPHRGLERALRRAGVGKYPLLAWHEVVIKPQDRPLTREEEEGHLTGRKCLHFVRSHRRRYHDGRETTVIHHWRGDPALGIAQTRYRVEPGRNQRRRDNAR